VYDCVTGVPPGDRSRPVRPAAARSAAATASDASLPGLLRTARAWEARVRATQLTGFASEGGFVV